MKRGKRLVPYHESCKGCKGGHDSFWKTVIESPQWQAWETQIHKNFHEACQKDKWPSSRVQRDHLPIFDVDECRECGFISQHHFQMFLKFCRGFK